MEEDSEAVEKDSAEVWVGAVVGWVVEDWVAVEDWAVEDAVAEADWEVEVPAEGWGEVDSGAAEDSVGADSVAED